MSSRQRIKTTLEFKIPDRIGVYDYMRDDTEKLWVKKGFIPGDQKYQDVFGYDLKFFKFDQSFLLADKKISPDEIIKDWQNLKALLAPCDSRISSSFKAEYEKALSKDLFLVLAVLGPFQHAALMLGLERLLVLIAEKSKLVEDIFSASAEMSIGMYNMLKNLGFIFDGAWLWSDLAYKKGCYFSVKTYNAILHKYHKQLCAFFDKEEMPIIFHCDGDCRQFIPYLLKAGIRALNPLEIDCGFEDINFLKKEYGNDLVLFGNMPTDVLEKQKEEIESVLSGRLEIAKKGGGFIYHGDKPVPPTVDFENYKFALDVIKKYGRY